MKIAILGNGGREHALAYSIFKSKKVEKIFCVPGNAGTFNFAENVILDINDFDLVYKFIKKEKIDLVIIGPEKPLVDGIVDYLEERKVSVFGPNKNCAQLEGSKIFTKKICEKYNIPTADFGIFNSKNLAIDFVQTSIMPIVIKADGLAAGKGVYICQSLDASKIAINEIFNGKFGVAENILIEEFLDGEEMSFFVISDGNSFKYFQTAQDHKRVGEGDTGKNTGGMGAYCPSNLINPDLEEKILNKIIKPTFKALNDLGEKYSGFLYVGLMVKENNPYLIEYNVRMGDPECQTILPLLKSDFLDLITACIHKKLNHFKIEWVEKKSLCIVLCTNGYPDDYKKNIEIKNLEKIKNNTDSFLFHAGTKNDGQKILAVGGRVLNFINISSNFANSRNEIINKIEKLNWEEGFFRKDIGFRVIE
jgi:phosphoribosylamine---glycine ligase